MTPPSLQGGMLTEVEQTFLPKDFTPPKLAAKSRLTIISGLIF